MARSNTNSATTSNGGFAAIPNWLIDTPHLTATDKLVAIALKRHAYGTKTEVFPSVLRIAGLLRLKRETVDASIDRLISAGLVSVIEAARPGRKAVLALHIRDDEPAQMGTRLATRSEEYNLPDSEAEPAQMGTMKPAQMGTTNKTEKKTVKNTTPTSAEGQVNNICPPAARVDVTDMPVSPGGTRSIGGDVIAAESAVVGKPKGSAREHLCGDDCGCFCGGVIPDCTVCYDVDDEPAALFEASATKETFAHPPVGMDNVMPDDVDEIEHQVDAGLWSIRWTLPESSEAPNTGLAGHLVSKYGYRRAFRQVANLRARLDFATKRIDKPFALLERLFGESEQNDAPAPRTRTVRADRIADYVAAVERGRFKGGVVLDDVPAYAKRAVENELAQRNKPAPAAA